MGKKGLVAKLGSSGISYGFGSMGKYRSGYGSGKPGYSSTVMINYKSLNAVSGYGAFKRVAEAYGASVSRDDLEDDIRKRLRLYRKECRECGRILQDYKRSSRSYGVN
jgi:hypothetical protein